MSQLVQVQTTSSVCQITLNRPEKLNALSTAMIDEFQKALKTVQSDVRKKRIHCVVVRSSSEKAFCVGADLSERLSMTQSQVSVVLNKIGKLMNTIAAFEVPTIALMNGAAFGGGLELALACDLRFAGPATTVGLTETKLAIIPGAGGTQRLTRLVGVAKAKELIFAARRLSAQEAFELGLVNKVSDTFEADLAQYLEELLACGPLATRAAKKAIDGGQDASLKSALMIERRCYNTVLKSKDRVEARRAFQEKRKPKFLAQ